MDSLRPPDFSGFIAKISQALQGRRKGRDLDWDYLEKWVQEFAAVPGRERLREQLKELRRHADPGES